MTRIEVAGGLYQEFCREGPSGTVWYETFGSGLRAAACLRAWGDEVALHGYAAKAEADTVGFSAAAYGVELLTQLRSQPIIFRYDHALSIPQLQPHWLQLANEKPILVEGEIILRFGMVEGDAIVRGDRVVYDPQSPVLPALFHANGSTAKHLVVVANQQEVSLASGQSDPVHGARMLCGAGASGVIVKMGPNGLLVVTPSSVERLPAYLTQRVWPLGSGDVFSAAIAGEWGLKGASLVDAAEFASKTVATYANSPRALPPDLDAIRATSFEAITIANRATKPLIYLAGPFFNSAQRWLVDQARDAFRKSATRTFSPFHDIGLGSAYDVAPKDLAALDESAVVLGLLDGLDAGTLFELGYARAKNIPVVAFVQGEPEEPLKMIVGSDCLVVSDFSTAVYRTLWIALSSPQP